MATGSVSPVFEGSLHWTGSAREADGKLKLERAFDVEFAGKPVLAGSSPPEFGGDDSRHNPETLMVASLMACHHLTFVSLCERAGLALASYNDHGTGRLAMKDGKMRMVEVVLRPRITLRDPVQTAAALALHEKTHANCFMSNSVAFEVRVQPDAAP